MQCIQRTLNTHLRVFLATGWRCRLLREHRNWITLEGKETPHNSKNCLPGVYSRAGIWCATRRETPAAKAANILPVAAAFPPSLGLPLGCAGLVCACAPSSAVVSVEHSSERLTPRTGGRLSPASPLCPESGFNGIRTQRDHGSRAR